MKLAISGKGGVGKTTLAAVLARLLADEGTSVIALDADLDSSLASALGVPNAEGLTPIVEMADLIAERTESGKKGYGKLFKLNPTVSDIPDKFGVVHNGVRLMVLGAPKRGGGGCNCPENVFLRTLLGHLALQRNETLILDMEAGTEHLGRATCEAMDAMIVVVEPGRRSTALAEHVMEMAREIGVKRIFIVANKVRSPKDMETLRESLPKGAPLLGAISFDQRLVTADLEGRPVDDAGGRLFDEVRAIHSELLKQLKEGKSR
ncbi:MAG: carbon monoxide dehydrogenase [Planctomycetes bacterium]|nr:carbon monoxide dehydrogenase [Planctomycetota bacterium]